MRTPYHSVKPPFQLRSNVIFFHDWRYVHHGATRWLDDEGKARGLWSAEPVPQLHWDEQLIPHGIRLRAMPATKSEPFLRCEEGWEGIKFPSTMLREDGVYRLWYEVVPTEDIAGKDPAKHTGNHNLLCYAESDDAFNWRRPQMDFVKRDGKDTNIVYGGDLVPRTGYHGGSIFRDPSAPAAERYKAFHLGIITPEGVEAFRAKRPDAVDPHNDPPCARPYAMYGAVSPDGLRWTPLPEPLVVQYSDTQNIAYYDEFIGKYVGYFRTHVMHRRSIGRAETDDFRRFPLPESLIWPGASVGPSDTWYGNGRTNYPGAPDYHLLFAKRWEIAHDRFHIHLAVSPDGILWSFPPDDLILDPGAHDAWDGGGLSVGCGMVELPGDRVGVAFVGDRIPHKYSRHAPLGEIAWAYWPKDRLVVLEAPERGSFATWAVIFKGNDLHLNVRTLHVGSVRVAAVGSDGKVIPGRALDDCDPIIGDFADRKVTWRGESRIVRRDDEPISFRVELAAAELFSMRFSE